jgi:hypothetical protein
MDVWRRLVRDRWDAIVVVLVATIVLWPIPFDVPRSQDHTVHLARAWIVGQNLASGHVTGWSPVWFFGFPAGELYPVLGDLAVSTIRALTLGLLPWAHCYALAFWAGYVLAALALVRASRVLGWGPGPGLVAALLLVLDPGETREGGYRFTAFFGVWLQPLAVSWTWLAMAKLHAALVESNVSGRRLLGVALLLAGALLAHPMTLPLFALMLGPFVLVHPKGTWMRTTIAAVLALAIAVALTAWHVLPMIAHRAWTANFGALHLGLARMLEDVASGAWATNMSAPVGVTITAGLVWAFARGDRFARFAAVTSLVAWVLASREAFWIPRLDRFADAFAALQYQRFVMCAKPGFFLAAGVVVTAAVRALWQRRSGIRRPALAAAAVVAAAWIAWLAHGTITHAIAKGVGASLDRGADPETTARFEASWRDYLAWAKQRWDERDGFFRFAYEAASRHGHGLADAPVFTGAPAFKIGSTPGETFVHRVESDRPAVLDRLRVRYLVTLAPTRAEPVATFGAIRVIERAPLTEVARIVGPGDVAVVQDEPDHVVVDVTGTDASSRLELAIAGYPRWQLRRDGEPVEWYEVPVVGDGPIATQADRRARRFVAGVADRTEPTEPMLLAADARDGRWELRYRRVLPVDLVAWMLLAVGVVIASVLWRRDAAAGPWLDRFATRVPPLAVLGVIAIAIAFPVRRWFERRDAEADLASMRLDTATDVVGIEACALEVDRILGPAACVDPEATSATATFVDLVVGSEPLTGYVAIDDTSRERRGRGRVEISARPEGGDWIRIHGEAVRFARPRRDLAIDLSRFEPGTRIDVRVRFDDLEAERTRLGFDLDLPRSGR